MLVLWRLDIGQQSPLKARAQAILQTVNGLGWPVTGDDNLLIGIVEGIEGMEKFFLGGLFARDKLNIVDQQNIDLAILGAKLFGFLVANSVDDFIGKLFRGDIEHIQASRLARVANGVQQVGFAQADAAIEKERIVDMARDFPRLPERPRAPIDLICQQ